MASPVVHANMVLGYTDLELKSYRLKTMEESSLFYVTNYPHKQSFQWKVWVRGHLEK